MPDIQNPDHIEGRLDTHAKLIQSLLGAIVDNLIEDEGVLLHGKRPQGPGEFSMHHERLGHIKKGAISALNTPALVVFMGDQHFMPDVVLGNKCIKAIRGKLASIIQTDTHNFMASVLLKLANPFGDLFRHIRFCLYSIKKGHPGKKIMNDYAIQAPVNCFGKRPNKVNCNNVTQLLKKFTGRQLDWTVSALRQRA
jgi:hypothetical protein